MKPITHPATGEVIAVGTVLYAVWHHAIGDERNDVAVYAFTVINLTRYRFALDSAPNRTWPLSQVKGYVTKAGLPAAIARERNRQLEHFRRLRDAAISRATTFERHAREYEAVIARLEERAHGRARERRVVKEALQNQEVIGV